jgi:cell division protein FtsL
VTTGTELPGSDAQKAVNVRNAAIALLVLLLLITSSVAMYYHQEYITANGELQDVSNQLQSANNALQDANNQIDSLNNEVANLNSTMKALEQASSNPTLGMWGKCGGGSACPMSGGSWREGGVPDTFALQISFTSTVPVTVYILTLEQYVQFSNCRGDISCVSGTYWYFGPSTSLQDGVFTLAEGCGDYVMIYKSLGDGMIYPNVTITYNPAPEPTGVCASRP